MRCHFLSVDPLEEMFRDPDRRAKLYLVLVGGMILSTILITVGTLVFILRLLGII
jgi:prolipoprotein diacylglyceryltransferase